MGYFLKQKRKEELKRGKSIQYIVDYLEVSYPSILNVFRGDKCTKQKAMLLINISEDTPIMSSEMGKKLEYYFDKK